MSPSDADTASTAEVRQLVRRLMRLQNKWPAAPRLHSLNPRMINGLLAYNRSVERGLPLLRLAFALICCFFVVLWAALPGIPFLPAAAIPLMLAWIYRCDASREYAYAVYALTQTDDLRVLPALIKATDNSRGRHPEVLHAILRLLQQVTEAHVGLLSRDAQTKLWYLALPPVQFETGYDEALAISALQAFVHVGNGETLSRMQHFARQPGVYPTHRRVNVIIEQLLPAMEARLQRQMLPQTLLRASDVSAAPSDTYLRAAYSTTAEPPQQLLRASTSEHPDTDA